MRIPVITQEPVRVDPIIHPSQRRHFSTTFGGLGYSLTVPPGSVWYDIRVRMTVGIGSGIYGERWLNVQVFDEQSNMVSMFNTGTFERKESPLIVLYPDADVFVGEPTNTGVVFMVGHTPRVMYERWTILFQLAGFQNLDSVSLAVDYNEEFL